MFNGIRIDILVSILSSYRNCNIEKQSVRVRTPLNSKYLSVPSPACKHVKPGVCKAFGYLQYGHRFRNLSKPSLSNAKCTRRSAHNCSQLRVHHRLGLAAFNCETRRNRLSDPPLRLPSTLAAPFLFSTPYVVCSSAFQQLVLRIIAGDFIEV